MSDDSAPMPPENEIQQVTPEGDDDADEIWLRLTEEPEVRGVEAARVDDIGGWLVEVFVAEFLRDDPLGQELRRLMPGALRSVAGVTSADEHDNETWFVTGTPDGEALTRAAADVVDDLADRARAQLRGE